MSIRLGLLGPVFCVAQIRSDIEHLLSNVHDTTRIHNLVPDSPNLEYTLQLWGQATYTETLIVMCEPKTLTTEHGIY